MALHTSATPGPRSNARRTSRKVRAVAIGGIVLGLGTMATLATWSDQEWAQSPFTAGKFNLEGSTDGTTFSDHATQPAAATVTFSQPFDSLAPGDSVAGAFSVRLAAGTTNNATVTVGAASSGTVTQLTYGIVAIPDATACTPAATGTTVVPAGTALGAATGATTFNLTKGASASAAGAAQKLCIQVTAGSGLVQGQTGVGIWSFTATSVGPR